MQDASSGYRGLAAVTACVIVSLMVGRAAGVRESVWAMRHALGRRRRGETWDVIKIVGSAIGLIIILALFMQVLPPDFIEGLAKFAVNMVAAPILNLPFSPVESPY